MNHLAPGLGAITVPLRAALYAAALLAATDAMGEPATKAAPVLLDQGWDAAMREKFYFTPQGSRMMPYTWFRALEQADGTELFADPANLAQYGWLSPGASALNPDGLPIGFTRDPADLPGTGHWLGLTCAACHTSDVTFKGATIRVEGAPSMADFGAFLTELSRAVTVNHPAVDDEKFRRFAARVLGADAPAEKVAQLKDEYIRFSVHFQARAWMRTPPLHAGPGRVDALTQIVNSLSVFFLGDPDNLQPPEAPTSYPFLWLTPRLHWVQWSPITSNPIARNAGEVLGVFGDANFGSDPTQPRFSSSVKFQNLFELEQWIDDLQPPRWREDLLGPIDEARWKRGAWLFRKDCRGCHNMPPFDMTPKEENIAAKQFIKITRVPYRTVGTDPLYVQSLNDSFAQTDHLAPVLFDGRPIVPAVEFLQKTVAATVAKGLSDLGLTPAQKLAYSDYRFHPPASPGSRPESYAPPSTTDIKAGPLLGIWATGPFLHNGSVPSIYELLSPPRERSRVFWVGRRELDVAKLGFVSTEGPDLFLFDTTLPGNRNSGHAFPPQPYTAEQRWQVIEYLKDPQRFSEAKTP